MKLYDLLQDTNLIKELHEYFNSFITEEAVKMVFEREDVAHIADAKELVDKCFESLAPKEQVNTKTINESR